MSGKRETDVLVVGAGPVGLLTALSLADCGVNVTILDKHWRTHSHSYALALHPGSLRLLDELSLAQELIDKGHVVEAISFYEGPDRRLDVDLAKLEGKFPYVVVVPQSRLEWALEDQLQQRGVHVLWNHELTQLDAGGNRVLADVTRYDKQSMGYPIAKTEWVASDQFQIEASQIVGADGYHSRVREQLGIELDSFGESQLFSVMEFSTRADSGREARVVIDHGSTNVLWPITDGRQRWTFQIDDPSQHSPTLERLTELARERAPWFEADVTSIEWSSPVRFERHLATAFGRPNVWLAGDAAHLTGPVGVQSMNVGLREARDVARRISELLRGGDSQRLFEGYDAERQMEWSRLLGRDGELRRRDEGEGWLTDHRYELLSCLPGSGRDLDAMLAQAGLQFS